MWGKKVRVYYHGIPLFCSLCYNIGHNRNCPNNQITWKEYIDNLSNGFRHELFGSWLSSDLSIARESQIDIPRPHQEGVEDDADVEFDFNKIPSKMLNLLRKKLSVPKTSTAIKKPKLKSKPKVKQNSDLESVASSSRGCGCGARGGKTSGRGQA